MSRLTDIEQQISHLKWRRMQSEQAIRSSLEQTNALRQKDTMKQLTSDQTSERRLWMSSVLQDEFSKPLVINDIELHKFQGQDVNYSKKFQKSLESHLDVVKKMKMELKNQECHYEEAKQLRDLKLQKIIAIEKELKFRLRKGDDSQTQIRNNSTLSKML